MMQRMYIHGQVETFHMMQSPYLDRLKLFVFVRFVNFWVIYVIFVVLFFTKIPSESLISISIAWLSYIS